MGASMLAYFPTFYEDEVLYSTVARYHRHTLSKSWKRTRMDLFGNPNIAIPFDLPSRLDAFKESLGSLISQSARELAWQHTLLPFYSAFLPNRRQAELTEEMRKPTAGAGRGLYRTLGLGAQRTPMPRVFRTCRRCIAEDQINHGETYWRRAHQLVGVHFCTKHAEPLVETKMPIRVSVRSGNHAAFCDMETESYLPSLSTEEEATLLHFSTMAVSLLDRPFLAKHDWLETGYREKIIGAGFKINSMDYLSFAEEFSKFYGNKLLRIFIGPHDVKDLAYWVSYFAGAVSRTNIPIRHLLIQKFFREYPGRIKPIKLVSQGPWLCRNPVAPHFGEPTMHAYTPVKRNGRRSRVGRFDCSCGFGFTGLLDEADENGQPKISRIKRFGDAFELKMIQLLGDGYSYGKIGAILRISTATVQRFVNERKSRLSGAARSDRRKVSPSDRAKLRTEMQKHTSSVRRVDWFRRDAELSEKLRNAAERLLAIVPPRRLSTLALQEAVGDNSMNIYTTKGYLPRTKEVLDQVVESVEAVQCRRIRWAFSCWPSDVSLSVSALLYRARVSNSSVAPAAKTLAKELVREGRPVVVEAMR